MRPLIPAVDYNPQYLLGSLGSGGVAVTFFIYLMFMVDHSGTPLVTFDHLYPLLQTGEWYTKGLILFALVMILIFAFIHYRLLFWNLIQLRIYKKTDAYAALRQSNGEIMLMALPLTLAMSINVGFILGALYVPGLWSVVEYLFPFALAGFVAVGFLAIKLFFEYFLRLLEKGEFDESKNNNLGQMLAIFAFSMIAVGFAAPGAMSHIPAINALGFFFSVTFLSVAAFLLLIQFTMGFRSMMTQGISKEAVPSIWIMVPILTLMGITVVRYLHGLSHHFDFSLSYGVVFMLTSAIVGLQIMFGSFGYLLLKRLDYFKTYVFGSKPSPGAYALVCPGVAFVVFGMFFIHYGLVKNGIIEQFSIAYFLLLIPLAVVQINTAWRYLQLNYRLLSRTSG